MAYVPYLTNMISIHALREESDAYSKDRNAGLFDFYPRSP